MLTGCLELPRWLRDRESKFSLRQAADNLRGCVLPF